MTPKELYNEVLVRSELDSLHPLHESMMASCCEGALMAGPVAEVDALVLAVQLSFVKMNEILTSTLRSAMKGKDDLKLEYRGNVFTIPAGSPLAG